MKTDDKMIYDLFFTIKSKSPLMHYATANFDT